MKSLIRTTQLCSAVLLLTGCAEQPLRPLTGAPDAEAELLMVDEDSEISATAGSFHELMKQPGRVVLVEFWGPHCPPCRQLAPVLDRLLKAHPSDLVFAHSSYGVRAVGYIIEERPNWVAVEDGEFRRT